MSGVTFKVMDFTGVDEGGGIGLDYPTAWAIQREVGETLQHDPHCSSVPGWNPLSGPGLLCDCGAVRKEWKRRQSGE
jgi:hypothetical protein